MDHIGFSVDLSAVIHKSIVLSLIKLVTERNLNYTVQLL